MSPDDLHAYVIDRLRQPSLAKTKPFPMFYAENVFPEEFYWQLQVLLATKNDYHANEEGKYASRTFADDLGISDLDFMLQPTFMKDVVNLFVREFRDRFPEGKAKLTRDVRLIRDSRDYRIGPHTDAPWKLISLLFYLPKDASLSQYGTSVFVPRDPAFRCAGGPHHKFEPDGLSPGFDEVWRAPFMPNSCLGFWKTDQSFHGVYPIPEDVRRDVLLYNVYFDSKSAVM